MRGGGQTAGGDMAKKWPKIDHIPPHFYSGRVFPRIVGLQV